MADINASILGQSWQFGISDSDAPVIKGMIATSANIKTDATVNAKAQSGQGFTKARALIGKKYTGTFSGYVSGTTPITGTTPQPPPLPVPGAFPQYTTFAALGGAIPLFIKSGTYSYTKGQFATMSVEIEGYDSITITSTSGGSGSSGSITGFAYGVPSVSPGGMITNTYSMKEEGEIFVTADFPDGTPGAIAMAPANKRVITETFTGYISSSFTMSAGDAFSGGAGGAGGVVLDVSEKRQKGEFVEVTITVETIQTLAA